MLKTEAHLPDATREGGREVFLVVGFHYPPWTQDVSVLRIRDDGYSELDM